MAHKVYVSFTNLCLLWDAGKVSLLDLIEAVIVMGPAFDTIEAALMVVNNLDADTDAFISAIGKANKEGRVVYGKEMSGLNKGLSANGLNPVSATSSLTNNRLIAEAISLSNPKAKVVYLTA